MQNFSKQTVEATAGTFFAKKGNGKVIKMSALAISC